ncbi:stuA [Candida pseudojiufengensis]|uniref:stuA n=1 Tax=Candida pseudojiufengensis TaxID=497109 RepID=UPI0022243A34|nr:stuA [Candida pseudojiufengensis]KAI5959913.1 stuA [Candida pseudojiufengensis]
MSDNKDKQKASANNNSNSSSFITPKNVFKPQNNIIQTTVACNPKPNPFEKLNDENLTIQSGTSSITESTSSSILLEITNSGTTGTKRRKGGPNKQEVNSPRIRKLKWISEDVDCFEITVNETIITRRFDNAMVNGTNLLSIAVDLGRLTNNQKREVLCGVNGRVVIKEGPKDLIGTYIPLINAQQFAQKYKISNLVYPFLETNLQFNDQSSNLLDSSNRTKSNSTNSILKSNDEGTSSASVQMLDREYDQLEKTTKKLKLNDGTSKSVDISSSTHNNKNNVAPESGKFNAKSVLEKYKFLDLFMCKSNINVEMSNLKFPHYLWVNKDLDSVDEGIFVLNKNIQKNKNMDLGVMLKNNGIILLQDLGRETSNMIKSFIEKNQLKFQFYHDDQVGIIVANKFIKDSRGRLIVPDKNGKINPIFVKLNKFSAQLDKSLEDRIIDITITLFDREWLLISCYLPNEMNGINTQLNSLVENLKLTKISTLCSGDLNTEKSNPVLNDFFSSENSEFAELIGTRFTRFGSTCSSPDFVFMKKGDRKMLNYSEMGFDLIGDHAFSRFELRNNSEKVMLRYAGDNNNELLKLFNMRNDARSEIHLLQNRIKSLNTTMTRNSTNAIDGSIGNYELLLKMKRRTLLHELELTKISYENVCNRLKKDGGTTTGEKS